MPQVNGSQGITELTSVYIPGSYKDQLAFYDINSYILPF